MGINRYFSIHSLPSIKELRDISELLSMTFKRNWIPGSVLSFDESLYSYQPRPETKKKKELEFKEPIPVVYIPRKPHPNGLLNWLCVSKSTATSLPYVIDMVPHLSFPQVSAQVALKIMIDRWCYDWRPNYVADSICGNFELIMDHKRMGISATFAMSKKDKPWLWELLLRCTHQGFWRAAINPDGVIASVSVGIKDGEVRHHKLITTSFKLLNDVDIQQPTTVPLPTSIELGLHHHDFGEEDDPELQLLVYKEQQKTNNDNHTNVLQSPIEQLHILNNRKILQQLLLPNTLKLEKKTVIELKIICKSLDIKLGKKNKTDVIHTILQIQNSSDNQPTENTDTEKTGLEFSISSLKTKTVKELRKLCEEHNIRHEIRKKLI
jgi:hypothetical protein